MKLSGDAFHLSNPQHQLRHFFKLLVGQAFDQVKAYITEEGINLADFLTLITISETTFGTYIMSQQ
jgi:hypothetical protein